MWKQKQSNIRFNRLPILIFISGRSRISMLTSHLLGRFIGFFPQLFWLLILFTRGNYWCTKKISWQWTLGWKYFGPGVKREAVTKYVFLCLISFPHGGENKHCRLLSKRHKCDEYSITFVRMCFLRPHKNGTKAQKRVIFSSTSAANLN